MTAAGVEGKSFCPEQRHACFTETHTHTRKMTKSLLLCCSIFYLNLHFKRRDIIKFVRLWDGTVANRRAAPVFSEACSYWWTPLPNLPSLFSSCSPCFISTPYHVFLSSLACPHSKSLLDSSAFSKFPPHLLLPSLSSVLSWALLSFLTSFVPISLLFLLILSHYRLSVSFVLFPCFSPPPPLIPAHLSSQSLPSFLLSPVFSHFFSPTHFSLSPLGSVQPVVPLCLLGPVCQRWSWQFQPENSRWVSPEPVTGWMTDTGSALENHALLGQIGLVNDDRCMWAWRNETAGLMGGGRIMHDLRDSVWMRVCVFGWRGAVQYVYADLILLFPSDFSDSETTT